MIDLASGFVAGSNRGCSQHSARRLIASLSPERARVMETKPIVLLLTMPCDRLFPRLLYAWPAMAVFTKYRRCRVLPLNHSCSTAAAFFQPF
jgi:hypothetical protein